MQDEVASGKVAPFIYQVSPRLIYLFSFAVVLFGYFMARRYYHDDAYITLKYAMNFLNGDGFVWNAGEKPVEGYSNFLFLMVVTALGTLGMDLVVASKAINIVAHASILSILFLYLRRQPENTGQQGFAFLVCLLLMASDLNLTVWTLGGLEAVFLSFFVICGVVSLIKYLETDSINYLVASSVLLCIGALTRLDAVLFIVVSGLFVLQRSIKRNTFNHVILFSLPGLIFIPYFWAKYAYYGEFLPNTFFAKAGGMSLYRLGTGVFYNLTYLVSPPFLLSFVILFSVRQKAAVKQDEKLIYLLCLIAIQVAYILYSGGDHMPAHRFFIAIQPVILITLYHLLVLESKNWTVKSKNKFATFALLWIPLQFSFYSWMTITTDPAGFLGKMTGQYISENFPKGSLIALNTAGSTPYHAPDNTYIDMLGLNDYHIARQKTEINFDLIFQKFPGHNKGDGQYVLDRKPDYIIMGPAEGILAEEQQWFLSGYQLSQMDEFHRLYEPVVAQIDVSNVENASRYILAVKNGLYEFTYYKRRESPELTKQ